MAEPEWLADRFEQHRPHLRMVAFRMLGSARESDSAVQEAWLRLSGETQSDAVNVCAWLTTVVGGVCLDRLQGRRAPRGASNLGRHDVMRPLDPVVRIDEHHDRDDDRVPPDSVGLALFVVLESLTPAERVAFVLHDMFAVSYDEIAAIVGRTPAGAEELARRARNTVRGADPKSEVFEPREPIDAS